MSTIATQESPVERVKSSALRLGTGLMTLGAAAFVGYAVIFFVRNFTDSFLELGIGCGQVSVGKDQIQEFSPSLYHYIGHLHIAVSGFIAATGLAVVSLSWFGVRRGPSCHSFCLIHPRPGSFADVRPDRVCAVRERWRTPVNAGQHCWKACWGQPLRSSNLLSSATLTRENTDRRCRQAGVSGPAGLICWSQVLASGRAAAWVRRNCFARSRASRTGLNREQHAVKACGTGQQERPARTKLKTARMRLALARRLRFGEPRTP